MPLRACVCWKLRGFWEERKIQRAKKVVPTAAALTYVAALQQLSAFEADYSAGGRRNDDQRHQYREMILEILLYRRGGENSHIAIRNAL